MQTTTGSAAPIESRQPGQVSPAEESREPALKKIVPARQTMSPAQRAVTSLLKEGWGYYRIENHERSIAIAERAQRLDPQRAEVYLLLAESYFAIGQLQLAEQLSQRGLLLSQNDATIRRKLQRLLDEIRG
ncbi:MAG: tetratricopeptide repeat protein [Candidatus Reddybacter sp.]